MSITCDDDCYDYCDYFLFGLVSFCSLFMVIVLLGHISKGW